MSDVSFANCFARLLARCCLPFFLFVLALAQKLCLCIICSALLCFPVAKSHLTMKLVIALLYLSSLFCAVDALKLATREADIDARASDLLLDAKMQAEQMNGLSERVRSLAQEVDAGGETAR